jgi:dTDP-4-amino-4,6-dideoxygalactose transaminase
MYYVLLASEIDRNSVLEKLKASEIYAVFHYVPLHSSPAGMRYGRVSGFMTNTDDLSSHLIRLPLWCGITKEQQEKVISTLINALN